MGFHFTKVERDASVDDEKVVTGNQVHVDVTCACKTYMLTVTASEITKT